MNRARQILAALALAAGASAQTAPPAELQWFCVPKVGSPARIVNGDAQVAEGQNVCDTSSKEVKPWTPPPGASLKTLTCGAELERKHGTDGHSIAQHWCRDVCEALPGCAPHPLRPVSAPTRRRPRRRRRPPPPPQEIAGEGPCKEDADCSVSNGRACCGCETIEVTSRLHDRPRQPACGCGDMSQRQRIPIPMPNGEYDESKPGPCGPMPPSAGEYQAVCREASCVAVRR